VCLRIILTLVVRPSQTLTIHFILYDWLKLIMYTKLSPA